MRNHGHLRQRRRRHWATGATLSAIALGACVSLSGLEPVRAAQRRALADRQAPRSLSFDEVERGIAERFRALHEHHNERLQRGSLPQAYEPPLPANDADRDFQTDPLEGIQ